MVFLELTRVDEVNASESISSHTFLERPSPYFVPYTSTIYASVNKFLHPDPGLKKIFVLSELTKQDCLLLCRKLGMVLSVRQNNASLRHYVGGFECQVKIKKS